MKAVDRYWGRGGTLITDNRSFSVTNQITLYLYVLRNRQDASKAEVKYFARNNFSVPPLSARYLPLSSLFSFSYVLFIFFRWECIACSHRKLYLANSMVKCAKVHKLPLVDRPGHRNLQLWSAKQIINLVPFSFWLRVWKYTQKKCSFQTFYYHQTTLFLCSNNFLKFNASFLWVLSFFICMYLV